MRGTRRCEHWFDGLAMLHGFAVEDGRVSYANRWLRSKQFEAVERDGKLAYSEFATDPCRSLFKRVDDRSSTRRPRSPTTAS